MTRVGSRGSPASWCPHPDRLEAARPAYRGPYRAAEHGGGIGSSRSCRRERLGPGREATGAKWCQTRRQPSSTTDLGAVLLGLAPGCCARGGLWLGEQHRLEHHFETSYPGPRHSQGTFSESPRRPLSLSATTGAGELASAPATDQPRRRAWIPDGALQRCTECVAPRVRGSASAIQAGTATAPRIAARRTRTGKTDGRFRSSLRPTAWRGVGALGLPAQRADSKRSR